MLIQLLYTSTPTNSSVESLLEFIPIASEMNEKFNITGMIISSPNMYMQVLEGPRGPINQLYKNILKDERHENCTLLRYSAIKHREFPNWSMTNSSLSEIDSIYVNAIFGKGKYNSETITGVQAMALLHVVVSNLNTRFT
jgi:hypothetical protein